jgi:hypothetical protein
LPLQVDAEKRAIWVVVPLVIDRPPHAMSRSAPDMGCSTMCERYVPRGTTDVTAVQGKAE